MTCLLAIFIYLGIWIATVATFASVIATVLWLRIGYAKPISRRTLPGHIALIVAQLVHGAELFAGGFADTIIKAFSDLIQPPNIITDAGIALSLSLSATVIWLLGGALAFYHVRSGGFVVLLLAVWSVLWPASHLLIPVFATAAPGWVPGMATGPILIALAILFLRYVLTLSYGEQFHDPLR